MQSVPRSNRVWLALAGVTIGRIAFGYQLQTVASLTPFLIARLGIGYTALGSLIGAYLLPGAFAALPLGLLGRRWGEGRVLAAGLLLMTVGNCIPALAPDAGTLAIGRVVAGLGAVAAAVMLGKVMADWFTGSRFVAAMGLAVGGFPLGVGLCQVASPWLTATLGWRSAFLAGAAVAGVAAVLVLAGPRDVQPNSLRSFGWPARRECVLVLIAGLVWTAFNGGYFGFLSYVPALLQSRGVPDAAIGWGMTLATWLNIPSILLGGVLAGRVGVMPVFLAGASFLCVAVAGIALTGHWIACCLLFGTLAALHPGVIIAAGTLSARPEHRAVGMGLFYTAYYVGGSLFPALCGAAADRFGTPAAALLTASAISVLSVPLFMLHGWLARHGPCSATQHA